MAPPLHDRIRIRDFRQARGLSQDQLAKVMGVDPSQVSRWESGDREPTLESISRLARALDVSIDVLMHAPAEEPPPDPHQQALDSARRLLTHLGVVPAELLEEGPPEEPVEADGPERCMVIIDTCQCELRRGHRGNHRFVFQGAKT
jgi:transcriptional regulator with XRE-family HTH domain